MTETYNSLEQIVPVDIGNSLGPALSINMSSQKQIKQEIDRLENNFDMDVYQQMIVPYAIHPDKLDKHIIEDHPIMPCFFQSKIKYMYHFLG